MKRHNATRRPIIFVCHSFGGFVVKRALIYSESLQHVNNEHLRSIYTSTYGILFFSTPHLGIDSDNWNAFVSSNDFNTHQAADFLPLSSAANSLNWTSETLHNVNRLFADKMGKFRILFLHETTVTKSDNGTEFIVNEVSAAPSISGVERAGIDARHNAITKFEDANSPGFEIVEEAIIRFCRAASNVIKNRWMDETSYGISRRKREAHELAGSPEGTSNPPQIETADRWCIRTVDFDLPYPRNLRFTGRQDVLAQIDGYFRQEATSPRIILLWGIGGIGKSEIALHYARVMAKDKFAICWIDARNALAVESSLIRIARSIVTTLILHYGEEVAARKFGFSDVISLQSQEPESPSSRKDVIRALKAWLGKRSNSGWLLVFDNYDSIDEFDADQYFPDSNHSRILITSCRPDLARLVSMSFEISNLDDMSALRLLLAGNKRHTAEDMPISSCVHAVLKKLCNLPLAIVQANAYINNRRLSMDDFLQHYEKQFNLTMAIQSEEPLAAETFFTCSIVDNENILPELIQAVVPGIRNAQQMQDCFEILISYCLMQQPWSNNRFWVPPVVHKWAWAIQSQKDRSRRSVNILRGLLKRRENTNSTKFSPLDIGPHVSKFVLRSLPNTETECLETEDAERLGSLLLEMPDASSKAKGIICLKGIDLRRYCHVPEWQIIFFLNELVDCLEKSGWSSVASILSAGAHQLQCQSQNSDSELFHLHVSAMEEYYQGNLEEAERLCQRLYLRRDKPTKETGDFTILFLDAEMLLAKIMIKHNSGPRYEQGLQNAHDLAKRIISNKIYTQYPETLQIVASYGDIISSHGDPVIASICYSKVLHLMADCEVPLAVIKLSLRAYCDVLVELKDWDLLEHFLPYMISASFDTDEKRRVLRLRAMVLSKQKRFDDIEPVARQLLDLEMDAISNSEADSDITSATYYLCLALFETERKVEAATIAEESQSLQCKKFGVTHPDTQFLGLFLKDLRSGSFPNGEYEPFETEKKAEAATIAEKSQRLHYKKFSVDTEFLQLFLEDSLTGNTRQPKYWFVHYIYRI
ncbi:hypothetical protein AOR_1_262124 [Paecilomyces variotii No. 5]|uniref:Orc1-like AAA ATPase domain-containing protein n=1 Tax=Byssochlamys spectabilis (strain No. 5 / NBRC 109023) TaxID=1356009 RepID=V5GE76_BYSSN|nr:hypothetical protein AOR_1_262124 [Paecilomyces variotii No. 5]